MNYYLASPQAFHRALSKTTSPHLVEVKSESALKALVASGGILKLDRGHESGFALTVHNELVCLFNNGPKRGQGATLVNAAIYQGAKHLNCFDGHLVSLYKKCGFKENYRVHFDWDRAPDNWPVELGAPDVVFMIHESALQDEGIRVYGEMVYS